MDGGGCVPFGYKALEKRLIIDAENCGLVKKIFELYIQYESVSSLQRYLNRSLFLRKICKEHWKNWCSSKFYYNE